VKFLADMGVSPKAVTWLRMAGHDAIHLREGGLHRLPDDAVFAKARAEDRIVLTFDLDFGEIVALNVGSVVSVIVFRVHDTRTERVIERLADVLEQSSEALEGGAIVVVEDGRHRVRRLPFESNDA
jgi:predicted nuclease of predicted toxin-antitoxin system